MNLMNRETLMRFAGLNYSIDIPDLPLVLLHGFTETHNLWDSIIPHICNMSSVIRPDLPGHGDSPFPDSVKSLEDIAEYIIQFLQNLGVKKCYLAGHSLGGYVALAMVKRFPEFFEGLCLVHSTPVEDSDDKKKNRKKSAEFIRNNGGREFIKTLIPTLFSKKIHQDNPEIVHSSLSRALQTPDDTLIRYLLMMGERPSYVEWMKNCPVPVTAILGSHDPLIPCDITADYFYHAPDSHVHVLHQSAHMGMLEEPVKFAQDVCLFMVQKKLQD